MNNEELYDKLSKEGATVQDGTLWYPSYYDSVQIKCDKRGSYPEVVWDGRGTQPSLKECWQLIRFHHMVSGEPFVIKQLLDHLPDNLAHPNNQTWRHAWDELDDVAQAEVEEVRRAGKAVLK